MFECCRRVSIVKVVEKIVLEGHVKREAPSSNGERIRMYLTNIIILSVTCLHACLLHRASVVSCHLSCIRWKFRLKKGVHSCCEIRS